MSYDISQLPEVRGQYLFNEMLQKHTWLGVGGAADVMFLPYDIDDLQNFLRRKNKNIPCFILGGGANLLVRDGGIEGVVIKLSHKNFSKTRMEDYKLYCGAGLQNVMLKKILPQYQAGGLEFLCSIPGTLGGAVKGNAGCFGSEISEVLLSAKIINGKGEILIVDNRDFHFAYRHSDFPSDWIVLEVCLQTTPSTAEDIIDIIQKNDTYRREHQPQKIRTAGSTFKNPTGLRAWELIKKVGGEKLDINSAHMSSLHCNFIDNNAGSNAESIEKLCHEIIVKVQKECNVDLELEIKIVGRKNGSR